MDGKNFHFEVRKLQVEGMALQVDRTLVQVDTMVLQVAQNHETHKFPKEKTFEKYRTLRNQSRSMNECKL